MLYNPVRNNELKSGLHYLYYHKATLQNYPLCTELGVYRLLIIKTTLLPNTDLLKHDTKILIF